jgi:hypothetical protein
MAHYGFRYAAQDPAFDAGLAVRAHGDQTVRRFFSEGDNLIGGYPVLGDRGHLLDAHLFDRLSFLFQVADRFFTSSRI